VHPYYSKLYGHAPDDFPVAYRQYLREVSLPIYSAMTDKDVADVAGAVLEVADGFRK
jgi:dTDP-4-amino-4,6-dideoxygalactose transaminase